MLELKRIGHLLLRVSDLQASIEFYRDLLGFELVEDSNDVHQRMVFLSLGESGHNLDLVEVEKEQLSPATQSTLGHLAFQVDTYEALEQAYFHLVDSDVKIQGAIDHISQKSIYFLDPDGNTIEIYHEVPNALQMFREGREDRDEPLVFHR